MENSIQNKSGIIRVVGDAIRSLQCVGRTLLCLMSEILKFPLGHCTVVYFDDILLYSNLLEEHLQRLAKFFQILESNKLRKCLFLVSEVIFLGFIINGEEIPAKIKSVTDWS